MNKRLNIGGSSLSRDNSNTSLKPKPATQKLIRIIPKSARSSLCMTKTSINDDLAALNNR
jgi:hypothetical protein